MRFRVAKFASHTISLLDKSTPLVPLEAVAGVAGVAGAAGVEDALAACSSSPIRRVGEVSTSEAFSTPTAVVQTEDAAEAAEEEGAEEEVLHQERAHKCTANTPAPLN